MEKPEQKIQSQSQTSSPTLEELIAIREELENLQNQGLDAIWKQIKNLNEQNAELLNEVKLLRQSLITKITYGVAIGTIALGIFLALA
jgi:hypothetical protein